MFVLVAAPGLDQDPDIGQTREPVLIEALIAQAAVELLDISVLVWLARLDEAQCNAVLARPSHHRAPAAPGYGQPAADGEAR